MATTVILQTTAGDIEIELDAAKAPVTVENFIRYVRAGHYDGTVFHRVMKGFMIQGGGFTPDGREKETRGPIKLESENGLKNGLGTVAMARTNDPDSATAQFFINCTDNGFLDFSYENDGYAVFGKVVRGLEAVRKIEGMKTGSRGPHDDWPKQDVVINKALEKK
ncbi:peptidyl-prolyl cis-trans isomerase [Candidatus Micrarchaeota archaeon]|nr:peptidyl-prolyl cis-trans isomerase [Candidatus Micrarchaeota archaeon]